MSRWVSHPIPSHPSGPCSGNSLPQGSLVNWVWKRDACSQRTLGACCIVQIMLGSWHPKQMGIVGNPCWRRMYSHEREIKINNTQSPLHTLGPQSIWELKGKEKICLQGPHTLGGLGHKESANPHESVLCPGDWKRTTKRKYFTFGMSIMWFFILPGRTHPH